MASEPSRCADVGNRTSRTSMDWMRVMVWACSHDSRRLRWAECLFAFGHDFGREIGAVVFLVDGVQFAALQGLADQLVHLLEELRVVLRHANAQHGGGHDDLG